MRVCNTKQLVDVLEHSEFFDKNKLYYHELLRAVDACSFELEETIGNAPKEHLNAICNSYSDCKAGCPFYLEEEEEKNEVWCKINDRVIEKYKNDTVSL